MTRTKITATRFVQRSGLVHSRQNCSTANRCHMLPQPVDTLEYSEMIDRHLAEGTKRLCQRCN